MLSWVDEAKIVIAKYPLLKVMENEKKGLRFVTGGESSLRELADSGLGIWR
jgi:hypothetical protein